MNTWQKIWENDQFVAHIRNGVIRLSLAGLDDPDEDENASFWTAEDLQALAMAARYPGKDF